MTTWHITKGAPTVEETAALTTVLTVLGRVAAVGQAATATPERSGAGWHRPGRGRHPATGMWRGR